MRRETRSWKWAVGGAEFQSLTADVHYLAELVELCGHCGAACTGTALFWYVDGDRWIMVEVDRPTVDELFEALWPVAAYEAMPAIFRHHNEGEGWTSVDATPQGTCYDPADLMAVVGRVREAGTWEGREEVVLAALQDLADRAERCGQPVRLAED